MKFKDKFVISFKFQREVDVIAEDEGGNAKKFRAVIAYCTIDAFGVKISYGYKDHLGASTTYDGDDMFFPVDNLNPDEIMTAVQAIDSPSMRDIVSTEIMPLLRVYANNFIKGESDD